MVWKRLWRFTIQRLWRFTIPSHGTTNEALEALEVYNTEVLEVYNTITWDDEGDRNKASKILEKFEAYCTP